MQPFSPIFVMTFIPLVIPSVYTRPRVCKTNISKMTYCCHYQKKVRNMKKITKMLVPEFLRRSENSNELPGKNDEIMGKEASSLTNLMQDIYGKFCLEFSDINMSFTEFCRGETFQYQAQRHVCQRHVIMSKKATASKVLPDQTTNLYEPR